MTSNDTRPQTEDVTATKGLTFEGLHLTNADGTPNTALLKGIHEKGFERPSPIQEESIPSILLRKDVLARAKNGTGKTAAYLIPCLHLVNPSIAAVQCVVLVPTRELAMQTAAVAIQLGKHVKDLRVMTSTGGSYLQEDILRFKSAVHVLVGTPGRIRDLTEKDVAKLDQCSLFVMDEADKLLSPEFQPLIEYVIGRLAENRQMMLFSATFPVTVEAFSQKFLKTPVTINLMDQLTLKGITQYYAFVEEKQKIHCLHTLFNRLDINQSIIFCNSVNRVELLAKKITDLGISCFYIHAKMLQSDRNQIFESFGKGVGRNLVCSDLFNRGIDVQAVNVVINFDFPRNSETYLHRIGRSGRYGHYGIAVNFVTPNDRFALYKTEAELGTTIEAIPQEIDKSLYPVHGGQQGGPSE